MAEKLFKLNGNIFEWRNIETFLVRSQYNELLYEVLTEYKEQYNLENADNSPKPRRPNFLNKNYCLTIESCGDDRARDRFTQTSLWTRQVNQDVTNECIDFFGLNKWFLLPKFEYDRILSLPTGLVTSPPETIGGLNFDFVTNSLTVGAVMWLYYYERMGIFKILGALLDDYNYRGKYTISGRRSPPSTGTEYSNLMDMICTLHRTGISSNLRDRICLYQRVLGVSIENNLGVESERNSGFMNTFNRLIEYMLEYYKTKQLAQAIQTQAGTIQPRSSVATQTSIRDTISVLKQHFEPLQYGRNLINTFLGIATVHATLCLVNMLKAEIGIPAQYEKPEEFIPAAYDILVAKRSHTLNAANRFIIYDNCASYGYRLLTDIETIDLDKLTTIATGSTLDTWLNDVEGVVEGYRNAYSAVPEKVEAIV
jgi:hypothetical protein